MLKTAQRVLVIGCSGGGKSTLSKALARDLDMPYISMDREFFWLPGWQPRTREAARALIAQAVKGERWLMDGTGMNSMDIRLPRAEAVVWLRLPRWLCLKRAIWRAVQYRGRSRPEMADGCPERVDAEFLSYIWNFERREVPRIRAALKEYGPRLPAFEFTKTSAIGALMNLIARNRATDNAAV